MDKLVGAFGAVLKQSDAPAPAQSTSQPQSDKQYLRLPVESARKLRWFEKADVQALTRSHFREKRELLDSIAALKKVLVRHGLDEAKLGAEMQAQLRAAAEVKETHEGVASVLLAALEPHVQELRFEIRQLKDAQQTQQRAGSASSLSTQPREAVAEAPRAEVQQEGAAATAASGTSPAHGPHMPLRLDFLDLSLPSSSARRKMDPVAKEQIASLEAQCEQHTKQVSDLKAALASAQQQAAVAARRRGPDGGGSALGQAKLQDMVLELQEAAREEARRAARAEARAQGLEQELKALQAQHKSLTKDGAALEQQVGSLQEQLATAVAAAKAATEAATGKDAKALAEAKEEQEALRRANAESQASLTSAQTRISRLEADLQLSQQREATLAAALAEAEALARRSDELAASNARLQQRINEDRAELGMVAYYKKVCSELTEAKARMEDEALSLAKLLAAAEARLADMALRTSAAEEHVITAEGRARAAEASVAGEVERRCSAIFSSRALWPESLREEFARVEARAAALAEAHAAATARLEAAAHEEEQLREQLLEKDDCLAALSAQSATTAAAAADQLQQLRAQLSESKAHAAGLAVHLEEAQAAKAAEHEQRLAAAAAAAAAEAEVRRYSAAGLAATAVLTPKWQVQNKVGGGGLYNLDAERAAAAGGAGEAADRGPGGGGGGRVSSISGGGGGAAGPGRPAPVDMVYMKNVVLKFLEAHVTNRAQERDMLLPAVATLLQVTQDEYAALQKIMRATAPPSRQMLSVLGLKL